MHIVQLFETPAADLKAVRFAEKEIGKFSRWLTTHNSDTPLKDCGLTPVQLPHETGWMLKASDAGMAFHNLYLVLAHSQAIERRDTKAYVNASKLHGQPIIVLVILLAEDPSEATDVAYRLNWSVVVHEFIHVMDYRRGYLKHKNKQIGSEPMVGDAHYNQPIEFNGYYQQGLHQILIQLSRADRLDDPAKQHAFRAAVLRDFASFKAALLKYFAPHWLHALNPTMRQRFLKRLYQLFAMVQREWPNMAAVREIVAERAADEERWAAEQPAQAVNEAFAARPYRWTRRSKIEWEAQFKIDRVVYDVSLFLCDSTQDLWELSFIATQGKKDFGFRASGTGNAWTVLGTVIAIAKDFIAEKNPRRLKIDNDPTERSRLAVNTRIANIIAGADYDVAVEEHKIFLTRVT